MTGETEPQPTLEESALIELGYGHCLDTPLGVGEGSLVTGRNFLDAYGNSPKRQDTEDLLRGFVGMSHDDPDYEAAKSYLRRFIEPYFGEPQN